MKERHGYSGVYDVFMSAHNAHVNSEVRLKVKKL